MSSLRYRLDSSVYSINSVLEGFSTLFLNRISQRTVGLLFLLLTFGFFEFVFPTFSFGSTATTDFNLASQIETSTQSLFSEKTTTTTQVVKFTSKTVVDPSLQEGETKVIKEGRDGQKVFENAVTMHNGQEYSKTAILIKTIPASEEVIAIAPTKQSIDTVHGTLTYYQKLNVWSTSYDPNCYGCSGITATGMKAGYGVIAVDPKVIPLGTKVYVPGYGIAVAGDTGGKIKGNKIDLGFDDISTGWWSARYTDIYLLSE